MWYTQPEVLRGDKYGCEADIWSLGVIFYVLLCGYPPFYDEDLTSLFTSIKGGMYEFHDEAWADVSPEAMDMIKKMLCVNRQKRWTAKQLLAHPWFDQSAEAVEIRRRTSLLNKTNSARRRLRAGIESILFTNSLTNTINSGRKYEEQTTTTPDPHVSTLQRRSDFVTSSHSFNMNSKRLTTQRSLKIDELNHQQLQQQQHQLINTTSTYTTTQCDDKGEVDTFNSDLNTEGVTSEKYRGNILKIFSGEVEPVEVNEADVRSTIDSGSVSVLATSVSTVPSEEYNYCI